MPTSFEGLPPTTEQHERVGSSPAEALPSEREDSGRLSIVQQAKNRIADLAAKKFRSPKAASYAALLGAMAAMSVGIAQEASAQSAPAAEQTTASKETPKVDPEVELIHKFASQNTYATSLEKTLGRFLTAQHVNQPKDANLMDRIDYTQIRLDYFLHKYHKEVDAEDHLDPQNPASENLVRFDAIQMQKELLAEAKRFLMTKMHLEDGDEDVLESRMKKRDPKAMTARFEYMETMTDAYALATALHEKHGSYEETFDESQMDLIRFLAPEHTEKASDIH
jgi:hypothetical protein